MTNALVKAILPRHVTFGGADYEVRPPTVREAVILLSVAESAMGGDDDSFRLVKHVLQGWYPSALFIASRSAPPAQVTAYALQVMNQGTPAGRRKASDVAGDARSIDWDDVFSLYMHTYGVSLRDVLAEPWSGFLVMSLQIGRIEARGKINTIQAAGLPYIKDRGERQKAFARLQQMAGIDPGPRKVSQEEAAANLKELAADFARMGALGRA